MAGRRVVHYTLEMSESAVSRRYDITMTGLTKEELRTRQKSAWETIIGISKRVTEKGLLVKGYPMGTATPSTIHSHIELIGNRDGFVPDLILLDYASLLGPNGRRDARHEEVASIFRDLRAMSEDLKVPVWTAAQANRGGTQTELLGMGDLAECFEINAIADVIISMNQTPEEREAGYVRYHFIKNREGESGQTWNASIDFARQQIKDVAA